MKSFLTAALVLAGSLGVASAAMAATPVERQHVRHVIVMKAAPTKAAPVKVMSETQNMNPGLLGVFQASDGVIYAPVTHDPRSHGLPNY